MGWLFTSNKTQKQVVDDAMRGVEVVASNKSGNAYYIAARVTVDPFYGYETDAEGKAVICFVILTQKSGGAWGYKDMTEGCGPYYYGASEKTLKALSVTTNESVNQWRENCREAAKVAAEQSAIVKGVKNNTLVKFKPVYQNLTYGQKIEDAGNSFLGFNSEGQFIGRYRVSGWKKSLEAVVEAIPA